MKTRPTPIKDILRKILGEGKPQEKLKQYSLFPNWDKIVGSSIAKHATPSLWLGEVLEVAVEDASWLMELKMMEEEILEKLRASLPEVKIAKIHWKI